LSSTDHGLGHGSNGMISDLPNHDFTAGPYNANAGPGRAPVGTYADLQRGPSPGPGGYSRGYDGYGATQYGRQGY
jgi:hypothetical protein